MEYSFRTIIYRSNAKGVGMPNFIDAAPGFDQPLAVLKHCHDRVRKQLKTLDKMLEHLRDYGPDEQVQHAAHTVLRFFQKAAPLHHQDEEENLFPLLKARANGEQARELQALITQLEEHHRAMEHLWKSLEPELNYLAHEDGTDLSENLVEEFGELYQTHLQLEDEKLFELAKTLMTEDDLSELGQAMQERRELV